MKKRISILLCVLVMAFSFSGCSEANKVTSEEESALSSYTEALISGFSTLETKDFESYRTLSEYALDYVIQIEIGFPATGEHFVGMMNSWEAAEEECGEYIGHEDLQYERTKDGFVVTTLAKFKERQAEISVAFDENYNMESLDVSAKFSMSEILTKAGLNTLLGMGVVFSVLIFLAFLISLMKYIPVFMERFGKSEKKAVSLEVDNDYGNEENVVEEMEDDLELIAVITAAIAAQEGTTTDGFVVRSIRRRPSNNWN